MCAASDGNDHLQRPRTQHHAKMIALEVLPPQTVVRSDDERARKGAVAADAKKRRISLLGHRESIYINAGPTGFSCSSGAAGSNAIEDVPLEAWVDIAGRLCP